MLTLLEIALFEQSSWLGTHHGCVALPQSEMNVRLGVSHRCFQKASVASLNHVVEEKWLTIRLSGPVKPQ